MIIAVKFSESSTKFELRYNSSRGFYILCENVVIRAWKPGLLIDPPVIEFEELVDTYELPF